MKIMVMSIIALSMLLSVGYARAVESLSTAELASHCSYYQKEPEGKDAVFCVRYIQGFIDGAVSADKRIGENIAFSTFYPEFCLGAPVQLKTVVLKVIEYLQEKRGLTEKLYAHEVVSYTLRKNYPCKARV